MVYIKVIKNILTENKCYKYFYKELSVCYKELKLVFLDLVYLLL